MLKIRDLLATEIHAGYVDWDKLSEKIFAALEAVRGEFKAITHEGVEKAVKIEDALTFRVKKGSNLEVFCYKILHPRFVKGQLYAERILVGYYSSDGTPKFPKSLNQS